VPVDTRTCVAQYLRMSTDEQKLSLAYQAGAMQRYAEAHGFRIVQTYEDKGRSGLTIKHRDGLARLLQDVVSGDQVFKAVLVYDVSRWGRFQDTDEAAHYEFLCRSAGAPIHYCSESFKNNCSSPAVIMKTLKRVMAAEYSRDLSQRLSRTKKILTERGFRAGGVAGYGLRRMLVSSDGSPKQILHRGEVKSFASGRVILVPGPPNEVTRVRDIYRLKISEGKSATAIAKDFNRQGLRCCGERWTALRILEILRNQKYLGWAVWGRTTGLLGKRRVNSPQAKWSVNPEAFEGLIDRQTFDSAQRAIADRTCNKTNEYLLDRLRSLLKKEGRLSQHLIDASEETPSSATYHHRFGGLRKAYALIGYQEFKNHAAMLKMRRRHRKVELALVARIAQALRNVGRIVRERNVCRRVLCLENGVRVSVLISQCISLASGNVRWGIKVNRFEKDYPTLLCRCTRNNRGIRDMYLMPRIDTTFTNQFRIRENDPWLKPGVRIKDLSKLPCVVDRVLRKMKSLREGE
jgi:DNA invertase Pin-like site-specific DNA recombinase